MAECDDIGLQPLWIVIKNAHRKTSSVHPNTRSKLFHAERTFQTVNGISADKKSERSRFNGLLHRKIIE